MAKKIIGGLFFAMALLMLVGSVANGTLFSDQGSAAATYGSFLGILLPIVLYVFSGIFMLMFDNATKLHYIDGFKKRGKQCSTIIALLVIYAFLTIITLPSVVSAAHTRAFDIDSTNHLGYYWLFVTVSLIPYFVPCMLFVSLTQIYVMPYWAAKKYFVNSDIAMNEELSDRENFKAVSDDGFVLASNKALFFPKLFCVTPLDKIASIKEYKQLWEKGAYIYFNNNKKIYILTKHYGAIESIVNSK